MCLSTVRNEKKMTAPFLITITWFCITIKGENVKCFLLTKFPSGYLYSTLSLKVNMLFSFKPKWFGPQDDDQLHVNKHLLISFKTHFNFKIVLMVYTIIWGLNSLIHLNCVHRLRSRVDELLLTDLLKYFSSVFSHLSDIEELACDWLRIFFLGLTIEIVLNYNNKKITLKFFTLHKKIVKNASTIGVFFSLLRM
jgi:hypothetical protein